MAPVTCGLCAAGGRVVGVSAQPGNALCDDPHAVSLPSGRRAVAYVSDKLKPTEPNYQHKGKGAHTLSEVTV